MGVLTPLRDSVSRVTMMVSFLLKGRGTVANTASCLVSVSASAAIMEEEAPLCVHLGLNEKGWAGTEARGKKVRKQR